MKKMLYLPFLITYICLCFCNEYSFLNTLKSLDLAEYKIFCDAGAKIENYDTSLLSGNTKIYSFYHENMFKNRYEKDAFCEQVVLIKNDVENYVKNNNLLHVKSESIGDIKIEYYYNRKLRKKVNCSGSFYNVVVAQIYEKTIIGYPAIMGSL